MHVAFEQEAEEQAAAKIAKLEAHAAAAQAALDHAEHIAKSPSDFSCHSYELFVGQEKGHDDNNKEKMSIRSEGLESVNEMSRPSGVAAGSNATKVRKVSAVSSVGRQPLAVTFVIVGVCDSCYNTCPVSPSALTAGHKKCLLNFAVESFPNLLSV